MCVFFCSLFISANAVAGVDKVYYPYVHEGELEIETRAVHKFDDEDEHKVRLGVGYGVNSFWFVEGYVIGKQKPVVVSTSLMWKSKINFSLLSKDSTGLMPAC